MSNINNLFIVNGSTFRYSIQLHETSQQVTCISLASHSLTWLTKKRAESAKLSLMLAEPSRASTDISLVSSYPSHV